MKSDLNFDYPLFSGWTTQDIIQVSQLYSLVAQANEAQVTRTELLTAYQAFKQVVPSKSEEKQLDRQFKASSGYSIYKTMQAAQATTAAKFSVTQ